MGKTAMLGSLEDTLALSAAIPGVLPCLDFAHLHARMGDGSMNSYDEWARALEAYGKALGDSALHSLHIHLSGIEYGAKGEKNHLPVAEADIDVKAIFTALKDFGCRGRILNESPLLEGDAQGYQELWQEISGEGRN
jgi:deoxyribonuclease-4